MAPSEWRIDELARRARLPVDTIRFYQREHLLPPARRSGRVGLYGPDHLERLDQIRELQARRFSLAAIRSLLEAERPGLVEGIFEGAGTSAALDYAELVDRAGLDPALADRLRATGLVRDPGDYGRDTYDAADLDMLHAVAQLSALGLPDDVVVELARIYTGGVERMQGEVLDLFTGRRGPAWSELELAEFQTRSAAGSNELLPLVTRLVEYVHRRTLQRLTLGAIRRAEVDEDVTPPGTGAPAPPEDAPEPRSPSP